MTDRPTTFELCGLDTTTLIGLQYHEALAEIISAMKKKRNGLAVRLYNAHMNDATGYEEVCKINTKMMYLDRAIEARSQDYEEMVGLPPVIEQFISEETSSGQSKKHSHYEITANQVAGIIIGWCLVYFVFPIMGLEPTPTQATISSTLFFFGSYIRAYTIRRIFNKWVK